MNLAVIGNVSRDRIWQGTTMISTSWGGAALNICLAAGRNGSRAKLISSVGQDCTSLFEKIDHLVDTGLSLQTNENTCSFDLFYSFDEELKKVNCNFGSSNLLNNYILSIELPKLHYHVCCREPIDPAAILKYLYNNQYSFSLDFISTSAKEQIIKCRDWLYYSNCIFVNFLEYEILRNYCDISKIKLIVVTNGKNPINVISFGYNIAVMECPPIDVYEVTGAGDTLTGTFLSSFFIRKIPLRESLIISINAAQVTLKKSGVL